MQWQIYRLTSWNTSGTLIERRVKVSKLCQRKSTTDFHLPFNEPTRKTWESFSAQEEALIANCTWFKQVKWPENLSLKSNHYYQWKSDKVHLESSAPSLWWNWASNVGPSRSKSRRKRHFRLSSLGCWCHRRGRFHCFTVNCCHFLFRQKEASWKCQLSAKVPQYDLSLGISPEVRRQTNRMGRRFQIELRQHIHQTIPQILKTHKFTSKFNHADQRTLMVNFHSNKVFKTALSERRTRLQNSIIYRKIPHAVVW